jgi:hypothetical protein
MVGRALVALKIANEDEIMAMIMRLQLKLTPRRANFAMRTRVLTFCVVVRIISSAGIFTGKAYQILRLLLIRLLFLLLEIMLLLEGRAQGVGEAPCGCSWNLHGALEW